MSAYVLTPLAKADVFHVWRFVAENNEAAAERLEEAIYEACGFVAEAPLRGHLRPDLTSRPLRFWTLTRYSNYAIVYRPETLPLQIVAVMHGRRNLRSLLEHRH